jgi:DNA sulfur modification protein DndB
MTQIILATHGITGFDEKHMVNRPTDKELRRAYQLVATWWETLLLQFTPFRRSLQRTELLPEYRKYQGEYSLLFRPIGQIAFMHALAGAVKLGLTLEQAVEGAEEISWSASDPLFIDTVVYANGHMAANEAGIKLAGRLGTYLIAWQRMPTASVERLAMDMADAKGLTNFKLP